jgi:hypothetical protein
VRGQSNFLPEKISYFSKLFRAARCFFQEEFAIEPFTNFFAESGRFLGIRDSDVKVGTVEYLLAEVFAPKWKKIVCY